MPIAEFKLERYFARYEFAAKYLLGSSDAESFDAAELLALADDESRALWNGLRLGYTETAGHPILRRDIARLYTGISEDDVLVFSGAEEAIYTFACATLGTGDHAVVMWPAYQSLHEGARSAGAEISLLRLRFENEWRLNVDELASLLRPSTACLILNVPHNPTGSLPDAATFKAVHELCASRGVRLFVDEVYRFAELEEPLRLPAACELSAGGVSLGGLAKPFGLAGLRIGWIATRDKALLARLIRFKDYLTICNSAPSEILAIAGLRAKDRILARNRGIALSNLQLLDGFFARNAERLMWVRPLSWLIGYPKLAGDEPVDVFAERLVEQSGVMIAPASAFGDPSNHFRIGFGRRNMPRALERFEAFVAAKV